MIPLPTITCDGCGACCTEQAALPVSWHAGTVRFHDDPLPPAAILAELREMRDRFVRDGFPPEGSPCVWYEAGRCRHYEYRPSLCRDEVVTGDEACMGWRKERGIP